MTNNTLITHGDCLLNIEHQNGNANAGGGGLPLFVWSIIQRVIRILLGPV